MPNIASRADRHHKTSDDRIYRPHRTLAAGFALSFLLYSSADGLAQEMSPLGAANPPAETATTASRLSPKARRVAAGSNVAAEKAAAAGSQSAAGSGTTELAPIVLRGERGDGPVNGIVAHGTTTGSKTDTPINEVPQAVSVVTREQMNQQNPLSVGDSLRYTPGVFADSRVGGVLESVFLRGFGGYGIAATNPQLLDGLPLMTGTGYAAQVIDPSTLERVEVLRGPASVLYGQAAPGGIVNMVSKQPTDDPYHDIGIETGNRNRIQTSFDFGGPLTDDGVWSYRLNGLGRRADEQFDFSKQQRIVLAPTLSWKPDEDTKLTIYGFYQNDPDNNFAGWLPAEGTLFPGPAGRIRRNFFLGDPNYDDYDRQQYMIGYNLEHRFSDALTVRQTLRYSHMDTSFKGFAINYYAPFGVTAGDLKRLAIWDRERLDGVAVDNQVEYRADTGPLQHVLLGGVSYQRTVDNNRSSGWGIVPAINYLSPVYDQPFDRPQLASHARQATDQAGLYLQDQIRTDRLVVTLGAREDWAFGDTQDRLTGSSQSQYDHAFSGRIGAVYLFDNGLTPYFSYSTSFQPTAGVDAGGEAYKPSKARQTEVGLRYQPVGWDASFTASLFDIHRTNISVTDPSNPLFYVQTGAARSRGVELEARVELTDELDLIGAFTYLDTIVEKDTDSSVIGNRLVGVPKQAASLWANYKFANGALEGLSLGGGIRYVGKSAGNNANTFYVPDATLFDAALGYDFGAAHPQMKGWRGAVNVSNLFDKTYVASCFSAGGCFYGNGRIVTASLHYQW